MRSARSNEGQRAPAASRCSEASVGQTSKTSTELPVSPRPVLSLAAHPSSPETCLGARPPSVLSRDPGPGEHALRDAGPRKRVSSLHDQVSSPSPSCQPLPPRLRGVNLPLPGSRGPCWSSTPRVTHSTGNRHARRQARPWEPHPRETRERPRQLPEASVDTKDPGRQLALRSFSPREQTGLVH